jgi:elongation factor Ts
MSITAAEVNKLRKQTGAGMMDCKKALVEAEGDFDKAIEILRKKGQKIAAKRGENEIGEGAVLAATNDTGTRGCIISLNCETDFVAKNSDYVSFAQSILDIAVASSAADKDALLAQAHPSGVTVGEEITNQMGRLGERLEVSRYEQIDGDAVVAYIHPGNRLSTLVAFNGAVESQVGKDVAMQAAAMSPIALDESSIAQADIDKELEIGKELAIKEGKPAEMAENIAKGRLKKWLKEVTLVHQAFIKNNKQSVAEYVKESAGGDRAITGFSRVSLD